MLPPGSNLRAPLLWLLVPFMAGLTAGKLWPAPIFPLPIIAGWAVAACGAAAVLARRPTAAARRLWPALLTGGVGLAGYVYLVAQTPPLAGWEETPREVTVTLEVTQVFPVATSAKYASGLGRITATDELVAELRGQRVYFSAIRKVSVPPLRSGRYLVRGVVQAPPPGPAGPGFDDYLENLGVRLRLTRAQILREERAPGWWPRFLARTGDRFEKILRRGLERHPETASLYLAMLLGEKTMLSAEEQTAFMRSGTFHIFSVSGLHVAAIAAALLSVLTLLRVPRRWAMVPGLAVLWLYVGVTGAGSPSVRAFLLIAFLAGTRCFRLPGNALAALTAAALLTLLLDPRQLFSTGFQMSYAVVTALVVMGVPLAERWQAAWQPFADRPAPDWRWWHHAVRTGGRGLLGALAGSTVAFLASTPSGIGYFRVLSTGSLVANLIVIPLSSLAIVAGFVSLLAGLPGWLAASGLFNRAAAVLIIAMDWLVRAGGTLPGMYFPARFRAEWMAPAALAAVVAAMLAGAHFRWAAHRGGFWPPVALVALVVILGVKFG